MNQGVKAVVVPGMMLAPQGKTLEMLVSLMVRKGNFKGCRVKDAVMKDANDDSLEVPVSFVRIAGSCREELKNFLSAQVDTLFDCMESAENVDPHISSKDT